MKMLNRLTIPLLRHGFAALCLALLCAAASVQSARADFTNYVVTNTSDSGPGSLRQAILDVGAGHIDGSIQFNINSSGDPDTDPNCDPITGVCTIKPLSALPPLSGPLTSIDGYTQSRAVTNSSAVDDNAELKIVLDGSLAGDVDGLLETNGDYVVDVSGLVIDHFARAGIRGEMFVGGCFIGTDVTGTTAAGNGTGVAVSEGVGFSGPANRNVISGNINDGVDTPGGFFGGVRGNFIGTDRHGRAALGNGGYGIKLTEDATTIGGTFPGEGNVISANGKDGVFFDGFDASSDSSLVVQGNLIGTDVTGTKALGNAGAGIDLLEVQDVTIGDLTSGGDNIIAYNTGAGIEFLGGEIFPTAVLRNSIFANGTLGIDALGLGVVVTNVVGADANFPVLTSAKVAGGITTIEGTLNGLPNFGYLLQFYANSACDTNGYGEGQTFLDLLDVTTDTNGNASFTEALAADLAPGTVVTATSTIPDGLTSEFSACQTVGQARADVALSNRANLSSVKTGQNLTYTLIVTNRGPDVASAVTVTDPLPANTTFVGASPAPASAPAVGLGGTVTWGPANLASGAGATLTVTVKVNTRVPAHGKVSLTNTAVASSQTPDPNSANNIAKVTTSVTGNSK